MRRAEVVVDREPRVKQNARAEAAPGEWTVQELAGEGGAKTSMMAKKEEVDTYPGYLALGYAF